MEDKPFFIREATDNRVDIISNSVQRITENKRNSVIENVKFFENLSVREEPKTNFKSASSEPRQLNRNIFAHQRTYQPNPRNSAPIKLKPLVSLAD